MIGKMILRFDDTNPSKEKEEYVQSIKDDLVRLGVNFDQQTHSSDYFEILNEYIRRMIREGKAYCDNTDVDTMRKNRGEGKPLIIKGIESP
jgi:glutamyl-tRNA synthetase